MPDVNERLKTIICVKFLNNQINNVKKSTYGKNKPNNGFED